MAIAAEREYGLDADVLAVDVELAEKVAWESRRTDELGYQAAIDEFVL